MRAQRTIKLLKDARSTVPISLAPISLVDAGRIKRKSVYMQRTLQAIFVLRANFMPRLGNPPPYYRRGADAIPPKR
jgi:hypothetical protein